MARIGRRTHGLAIVELCVRGPVGVLDVRLVEVGKKRAGGLGEG